jgi:hypothetical protein
MPVTSLGVSSRALSVWIRPSKLSSRPQTCAPALCAVFTTGADDRVQAGGVAATGQHSDALYGHAVEGLDLTTINRVSM